VAGALGGIVPFIGFIVSIRGFNALFRTVAAKYQFDLFFQRSILTAKEQVNGQTFDVCCML
jgi:hypothetical protein